MSWDAGSIVGKLMLDIDGEGGFATSMMAAEGMSRIFPDIVNDFLVDPILGFADALKETGEVAVDTFKEIQQDAENVGLSSLKLGVSPEFFSQWSKIGETVQVGQAELSQGLRFLELNAQEALEGSKKAVKGFADVGISMSDLQEHEGDAAWLFEKSREGLQRLAAGQERILAGKEVMGKGGQSLLPLLLMEQQHVDDLTKSLHLFGDTVDSEEVKSAQKFQDLESVSTWAIEGIGKAAEKPILAFLNEHALEIQGIITEATTYTIGKIDELWTWIDGPKGHAALQWVETEGKAAWNGIKTEVGEVEDGVKLAWDKMQDPETRAALKGIGDDFKTLWGLGKQWTNDLINDIPAITADLKEMLDLVNQYLPKIVDAVGWTARLAGNDINWLDNKGDTGASAIAGALGHPLQQVPPSPHMRPKPDAPFTPNPSASDYDNRGEEEQSILGRIYRNKATPADFQRFQYLSHLDQVEGAGGSSTAPTSAKSTASAQHVTVNVQTLHVTLGGSSPHGPIDAALKKEIDKAQRRAVCTSNVQASIGGG